MECNSPHECSFELPVERISFHEKLTPEMYHLHPRVLHAVRGVASTKWSNCIYRSLEHVFFLSEIVDVQANNPFLPIHRTSSLAVLDCKITANAYRIKKGLEFRCRMQFLEHELVLLCKQIQFLAPLSLFRESILTRVEDQRWYEVSGRIIDQRVLSLQGTLIVQALVQPFEVIPILQRGIRSVTIQELRTQKNASRDSVTKSP